jgi:uncharacterized protein (TIGR02145 family)
MKIAQSIGVLLFVFTLVNCSNSEDSPANSNVIIGSQIWSSTNLDVTTYRDGTPIPQVTDATQWAALTTGAWCYYDNDPANGPIYGKLYNWYAVAGIYDDASLNTPSLRKQFAPTGWHVPSDADCSSLINYLDPNANGGHNTNIAGGKMKETGTAHWTSPNTDATNSSGFKGLPGGIREGGSFIDIGNRGYCWSSSEYNTFRSVFLFLFYDQGSALISSDPRRNGFSVRCVRD